MKMKINGNLMKFKLAVDFSLTFLCMSKLAFENALYLIY